MAEGHKHEVIVYFVRMPSANPPLLPVCVHLLGLSVHRVPPQYVSTTAEASYFKLHYFPECSVWTNIQYDVVSFCFELCSDSPIAVDLVPTHLGVVCLFAIHFQVQ